MGNSRTLCLVTEWVIIMITSCQSNLTADRIVAAHGRFSDIRQVALVCTPPNRPTWFLGPTRVQIPNAISIGSAVFAHLTTESRYTLQWTAPSLPQNCLFPWGIWTPYLIHGSLGQPKRHLDRLSCFCRPHYCGRPIDGQTTLLGL